MERLGEVNKGRGGITRDTHTQDGHGSHKTVTAHTGSVGRGGMRDGTMPTRAIE